MRSCPKCKTSSYNNRNFALLINECGHSRGNSAPCPTCGRTLKRQAFWVQTFDDPQVEKEVYFRKKLKKIYNLQEDDFPTLLEYNNYLEELEELVANLTNDRNVTETQEKVAAFTTANKEKIAANRTRKTPDEIYIAECMQEEKEFAHRVNEYKAEDARIAVVQTEEQSKMQTQHRKLIDELAHSELPAELIVDKQRKTNIEQRQVRQALEEAQEENIAKQEELAKARRKGGRKAKLRHEDVEPYTFHMCDTNLSSAPTDMYSAMPAPQLEQMAHYVMYVVDEPDAKRKAAGAFTKELIACHSIHSALMDIGMNCVL